MHLKSAKYDANMLKKSGSKCNYMHYGTFIENVVFKKKSHFITKDTILNILSKTKKIIISTAILYFRSFR